MLNKNKLLHHLTSFNEHTEDETSPCPWKKSRCFKGDKALPSIESWHVSRLAREVFSCFLQLQVNNTGEHFQALRNTSVWVKPPHRNRPRPARRSRGRPEEAPPRRGSGSGRGPGRPELTFAGLLSGDALCAEPLVQDIEHLPAQVQEQQRQRPRRHGDRRARRRRRCRATRGPIGRRRLGRWARQGPAHRPRAATSALAREEKRRVCAEMTQRREF